MKTSIKLTIAASLAAVIQLITIILKLCGVVDWSWTCVMLPTIIVGYLTIAFLCVVLVIYIFTLGDRKK